MQNLTQPTLLLKPFAESGDKNTLPVTNTDLANPQLADLTNGFPQITSQSPDNGGLPPERKDFNGLGYLTTSYDWFYQAGGTFTFNSTISSAIGGYPLGARLWYTDGNGNSTILRSTKNNNTDNFNTNPSYIGTSWVVEIPVLAWNNTWTGSNTFTNSVSLGALATATTQSASDNSTKLATTEWVNTSGNNVMHLSGNETASGAKTFSSLTTFSGGVIRKASWTGGTTPSSTIQVGYNFEDASGTNCGSVRKQYGSNGAYYTQMVATKTDGTGAINISIGYNENGLVRATAPTPDTTTATNSTQIATTGWVNTVGNNVVHLSGNETIAGSKTFSSTITGSITGNAGTVTNGVYTTGNQTITGDKTFSGSVSLGSSATATTQAASDSSTKVATTEWANTTGNNIVHLGSSETITGEKTFTGTTRAEKASAGYYQTYIKNTAVTIGTAPSTNTGYQLIMNDSSGTQNGRIGALSLTYKTDGACDAYLMAYKPNGSGSTNSTMGIRYPASGDPYGYAPNSDVVGSILTTAAITKSGNGYLTLGNGVIIQWGKKTMTSSSEQTITFPTPFSNTNYRIVSNQEEGDGYGQIGITARSKTAVTCNPQWSGDYNWIAIGY